MLFLLISKGFECTDDCGCLYQQCLVAALRVQVQIV